MMPPQGRSDPVAARLAKASERLRAQHAHATSPGADPPPSLTAAEALVLLREACDGLAATQLEVRRARSEIARLVDRAAAHGLPLDAA